jgi:small conductance mechanosensitive channel
MIVAAAQHLDIVRELTRAATGDRVVIAGLVDAAGSVAMNLVIAALILAATLWLANHLSSLARRGISGVIRRQPPDPTLQAFVGSLTRYVIIIIGMIAVLQQLGVKTTSVIAVLGAASLAIGLALQGALSNVAAGVMILLLRPYRIGDHVMIDGKLGQVKALDLFSTRLSDPENLDIFVPNGKVFGTMVINYSSPGRRRFELEVGIAYDDDPDLALRLMREIAGRDSRILKEPAPWTKVVGLADNTVRVMLRAHTAVADWQDAKFDTLKAIKQTFEARGLTIRSIPPAAPPWVEPAEPVKAQRAATGRSAG